MKKFSFILLIATVLNVANVFAQDCELSGTTGPLSWCLKDGTLTISGEGDMPDYSYPDYAPWYEYRESINAVVIETGVTTIGDYAFQECPHLTSVTIPTSVTSIRHAAFLSCSGLTSITIPNSIITIESFSFQACSGLTSITFPNSVTDIGMDAFQGCGGLTSITIPNSVISIGDGAFSGCASLKSIDVESNNMDYASENGVLFDKSKTILIQYPAGKTNKTYTISNSVTTIERNAFMVCTNLTFVTIPNSITSIKEDAFYACIGLTSVIIPNSVTIIESGTFGGCGLISVTIPNSVTSIGTSAFYACSNLTSVTIGNSVTSIGEAAFRYCAKLTSVTIPNSVTTIGENAFEYCASLTSVTIPNSVTTIEDYAFAYCTSLTTVTNLNPVPVAINSNVFGEVNQSACTLRVSVGSVSAYENAEVWKEFNVVDVNAGIVETDNYPSVRVYPNPTNGILHVETRLLRQAQQPLASLQDVEMQVFDIMGRSVRTAPLNSPEGGRLPSFGGVGGGSETSIDISYLPSGIYFLKIAGKVVKFVKE